jgi:hypothetical protein
MPLLWSVEILPFYELSPTSRIAKYAFPHRLRCYPFPQVLPLASAISSTKLSFQMVSAYTLLLPSWFFVVDCLTESRPNRER